MFSKIAVLLALVSIAPVSFALTCSNSSSDPSTIQSAVNSGGTVTLSGTCNMASGTVTVANAVTINGTASLVGSGVAVTAAPIFTVTANNVTITGLTFSRAQAVYVNGTNVSGITFTYNSVSSTNGGIGFAASNYLTGATISHNSFQYMMQDGYQSSTNATTWNNGIDGAYGEAIRINGGMTQTIIEYNTIDYTGNDGISVAWGYIYANGGANYILGTGNSVSYNTLTHIHRIGIELQGEGSYVQCTSVNNPPSVPSTPSTCTPNLASATNSKVNGNYIHSMFLLYYDAWTSSLVDNFTNSTFANNTFLYDNEGGSCNNPLQPISGQPANGYYAAFMEWGGGTRTAQGNVFAGENITSNGVNCTAQGTPGFQEGGAISGSGITYTTKNNILAYPTWASGPNKPIVYESICSPNGCSNITYTNQYNYIANASPYAGSLTTSAITPAFSTSSTSGGIQTFSFTVISALSIRGATYTVDGTMIGSQEVSNLSTTFASDRKWLYSVPVTLASYSSSSHSLVMTVTDASGATSTASTTFTGTGGGTTPVNIMAGLYHWTDTSNACSNSGSAANCAPDAGFALYGSNNLTLFADQGTSYANQQWQITAVSGGFSLCAPSLIGVTGQTNACLADTSSGDAVFNSTSSNTVWTIQTINGSTYSIKNNATGNYIQNSAPGNSVALTMGATAYQWAMTVIIPAPPAPTQVASVVAGGTVTLTSPTSVAWSIATGTGSLSTAGPSTSTVYTAVTGATAQHRMLGCPVTPNDSIFNTNISALPTDANSSTKIINAGTISGYYYSLVFEPSWGVSRANNSTSTQTIRGYYTPAATLNVPVPSGSASLVEGGNYSGITGWLVNNQANPDHHNMIVNYQTCGFYDVYDRFLNGTYRLGNGTTTPTFQAESEGLLNGLGYGVITPGGTDAAGLPLAPLTWTADEVRAGPPKHAVRFTSKGAQFAANIWKWPASNTAGGNSGATYGSNGDSTNYIALGSRLRLKAAFTSGSGVCTDGHGNISSTACNTGTICVSPLTTTQITYCQNMLTSLQTYGMVNADTGDAMAITPSLDFTADNDVQAAYKAIQAANIAITSFEVIDEDSLFETLNTYETTPNGGTSYPQTGTAAYGGITYTPATQSYVSPANQVIVSAGSTGILVGIQPVLVGVSLPLSGLVVAQSATIDLSLNSWVNPSTESQSITWTVLGTGCGAFSGTIYTAPSSGSSEVKCSWHGVAAADSAATIDIPFTVVPTASGAIRIDSGSTVQTTDANGNIWYPETGLLSGVSIDSTPYSYWNAPNQNQYATAVHGIGDMRYTMIVPNGNYKVHILIGYAQCAFPCGSWPNATYVPQNWSLHEVESQDIVTNHLLDWSYPTGYGGFKDSGIYIPATVTNGILTFSLDALVPDINCNSSQNAACTDFWTGTTWQGPNLAAPYGKYDAQFNTLAGVEVLPDTTSAFLGIDLTNQTCSVAPNTLGCGSPYTCGSQAIQRNQICAGQTLTPIYPQPWYFTLSGTTIWTLNDPTGKASIASNADGSVSLSLSSGAVISGQPIQLTAQNGAYTSQPLKIYTVGTRYAINPKPLVNHYAYVRSITINHSQVAAAQTNFPVLVSFTDPTLASVANGGNVQNAKGYDIVFASNSSGTPTLIPWEIESYNPATGAIVAHVLISSLSSTANTVIYLFYGNNSIVSAQNTASNVWNSNFTSVYHFGSQLGGASLSLSDSTSNARNLLATSPSPSEAVGIIGPGVNGFGTATLLTLPTATISQTQGTIEGWINTTQAQTNAWDVLATNDGTSPSLVWAFNHPYTSGVDFGWAGTGSIITVPFAYLVTPVNTWHHIAYTYSGSAQTVYEDGVSVYSVSTGASTYAPSTRPIIGTYPADAGYYFQGTLDEMRFSNIALSASWIQTEYNSYFAPSTFFVLGSQTAN